MNNNRHRSPSYLRYLKPGALAQLRNSKIKTITHQIYLSRTITTITSSPVSSVQQQEGGGEVNVVSELAFAVTYNGPSYLGRKKVVAVRSAICFDASGLASDGPQPVIDAFSNGFLVAH